MLRKPGRMRWDYSQPKGKLFISDGKFMWLYTPADNRAEKMKLQESDDMRAPLAFLLGRLNFQKEFRNLQARPEGADMRITAEPKTDNLPYSAVEFVVTAENRIRAVKVTGFDHSILDFTFDEESLNPPLGDKLFQFQPPAGAEVVEGRLMPHKLWGGRPRPQPAPWPAFRASEERPWRTRRPGGLPHELRVALGGSVRHG